MTIQQAKKIYCVGIGGIGVSGLARLFLAMGKQVAGSDLIHSDILESVRMLGAKIFVGQDEKDLLDFKPDLIVYSSSVTNFKWPANIPKLSHGEAIGELMDGKYGIGVTGTNGKSTTTALLGLILEKANLDPTILIGSNLSPKNETEKFRANARLGQGNYIVAESDEFDRKMLMNKPKMIVITNIALDHLDTYKNLDDIKSAFLEYVKGLPADGILIYNADDHNAVEVCKQATCHKFTFGIHHYADLQAINQVTGYRLQTFDMHYNDEMIGSFKLQAPGLYNIANALGAALAAIKLGVSVNVIRQTFEEYVGLWRRFEIMGEVEGKIVISDYAHHPDGITGTIQAAKEFYPGKKILTVFQPHHRNRTAKLFKEFVEALVTVDDLIIPEIFDVAGREHGEQISSRQLVEELNRQGDKAIFVKDLDETEKLIREKIREFDVILLMGAGDIDKLARKLVK
jgi:UDP-N-acetylmuramate--alanine ligase